MRAIDPVNARILNIPYKVLFVKIFVVLVPFGMLQEFNKLGENLFWLTIPFSVLVSWILLSMERVGEVTENPFEGSSNDIPMTQIARNIEIDLLDMIDEKELPSPIQPKNNIVM